MSTAEPVDPSCPSCGRPFGDRKRCLYCAATRDGRVEVERIQLFAFPLLAAAVLCFLQAIFAAPSYRPIASLGEKDNFRRVRVRGEVRSVRVFTDKYEQGTSVVVELEALGEPAPGTDSKDAEIRLKADGRIGHELKIGGRIPSVGDILDVSASVFAGAGYRLLSLNSAHNLKVIGATANKVDYVETTVAEVLADPEAFRGRMIALSGVRIAKRLLGRFHLGVTDGEGSPELRVYGLKPQFYRPDDVVSLRGQWHQYKEGKPWELRVDRKDASGCVVLEKSELDPFPRDRPKPEAPKVITITEILANPEEYRDKRVRVERAAVALVRERLMMEIRDETGADTLTVFGVAPWKFEPGDIVSVTGKLARYEKANRWEIKVGRRGRGVRVLEKQNPDRQPATMAQLLATPEEHADRKIRVPEAIVTTIVDATSFRIGEPADGESAPASPGSTDSAPATGSSTGLAPDAGTPAGSLTVIGSSTSKLTTGARIQVRGTFVSLPDGDGWQIQVAVNDLAAVRPRTSRRRTEGGGR